MDLYTLRELPSNQPILLPPPTTWIALSFCCLLLNENMPPHTSLFPRARMCTVIAVTLGISTRHFPGGIAVHSERRKRGACLARRHWEGWRGSPEEPAGHSITCNMASRDRAVAEDKMISVGQCWILWVGKYLKCAQFDHLVSGMTKKKSGGLRAKVHFKNAPSPCKHLCWTTCLRMLCIPKYFLVLGHSCWSAF